MYTSITSGANENYQVWFWPRKDGVIAYQPPWFNTILNEYQDSPPQQACLLGPPTQPYFPKYFSEKKSWLPDVMNPAPHAFTSKRKPAFTQSCSFNHLRSSDHHCLGVGGDSRKLCKILELIVSILQSFSLCSQILKLIVSILQTFLPCIQPLCRGLCAGTT